jgi:hypothetical protein
MDVPLRGYASERSRQRVRSNGNDEGAKANADCAGGYG